MRLSWKKVLAALLMTMIGIVGWWLFGSKFGLEVSNYTITTPKLTAPIRIVQLSDLHNSEFGEGNARLVRLVQKQQPDMILLTGDMVNGNERKTDVAVHLIEQLASIAPVYASMGNHESAYWWVFGADMQALYEDADAVLLEQEHADVEINGQKLRIGGILGYCLAEEYLRTGEARPKEIAYLKAFQDTERLTILMCHMPLCWIKDDNLEQWAIDCIFAGHAHGGQIRLPFVGGEYAPDQEWFPGRMCGLYYSKDRERVMVLSRGLGSSGDVPRVNNVPEIVVVDILPRMR